MRYFLLPFLTVICIGLLSVDLGAFVDSLQAVAGVHP